MKFELLHLAFQVGPPDGESEGMRCIVWYTVVDVQQTILRIVGCLGVGKAVRGSEEHAEGVMKRPHVRMLDTCTP